MMVRSYICLLMTCRLTVLDVDVSDDVTGTSEVGHNIPIAIICFYSEISTDSTNCVKVKGRFVPVLND
jgi:hypothetical protein